MKSCRRFLRLGAFCCLLISVNLIAPNSQANEGFKCEQIINISGRLQTITSTLQRIQIGEFNQNIPLRNSSEKEAYDQLNKLVRAYGKEAYSQFSMIMKNNKLGQKEADRIDQKRKKEDKVKESENVINFKEIHVISVAETPVSVAYDYENKKVAVLNNGYPYGMIRILKFDGDLVSEFMTGELHEKVSFSKDKQKLYIGGDHFGDVVLNLQTIQIQKTESAGGLLSVTSEGLVNNEFAVLTQHRGKKKINIIDSNGKLKFTIENLRDIHTFQVDPVTNQIHTFSSDGIRRIYEQNGQFISESSVQENWAYPFQISPKMNLMASGQGRDYLKIFDSKGISVIDINTSEYINEIVFSPDEKYVAVSFTDGNVKLFQIDNKDVIEVNVALRNKHLVQATVFGSTTHFTKINSLEFDPESKFLSFVNYDKVFVYQFAR